MVCLGNICINTLHKGAKDDDDDNDDDNDNNNNNNTHNNNNNNNNNKHSSNNDIRTVSHSTRVALSRLLSLTQFLEI
jgi:hypothetical protein